MAYSCVASWLGKEAHVDDSRCRRRSRSQMTSSNGFANYRENRSRKRRSKGGVERVCKSEGCRSRKIGPSMAACDGFASDSRTARLQSRRKPPTAVCKAALPRHERLQTCLRPPFRPEKPLLGTFLFCKAVAVCHLRSENACPRRGDTTGRAHIPRINAHQGWKMRLRSKRLSPSSKRSRNLRFRSPAFAARKRALGTTRLAAPCPKRRKGRDPAKEVEGGSSGGGRAPQSSQPATCRRAG